MRVEGFGRGRRCVLRRGSARGRGCVWVRESEGGRGRLSVCVCVSVCVCERERESEREREACRGASQVLDTTFMCWGFRCSRQKAGGCPLLAKLACIVRFATKSGICPQVCDLSTSQRFVHTSAICPQVSDLSTRERSVHKSAICPAVDVLGPPVLQVEGCRLPLAGKTRLLHAARVSAQKLT